LPGLRARADFATALRRLGRSQWVVAIWLIKGDRGPTRQQCPSL
jgi:hypothetical protein